MYNLGYLASASLPKGRCSRFCYQDSKKRHIWYLDEMLVPLALIDPDVEQAE